MTAVFCNPSSITRLCVNGDAPPFCKVVMFKVQQYHIYSLFSIVAAQLEALNETNVSL